MANTHLNHQTAYGICTGYSEEISASPKEGASPRVGEEFLRGKHFHQTAEKPSEGDSACAPLYQQASARTLLPARVELNTYRLKGMFQVCQVVVHIKGVRNLLRG